MDATSTTATNVTNGGSTHERFVSMVLTLRLDQR
jgi:hypothetical protein